MPDGEPFVEEQRGASSPKEEIRGNRKFYRNPYDKRLGGVCSGLSIYFVVWIFLAGSGLLVYVKCTECR